VIFEREHHVGKFTDRQVQTAKTGRTLVSDTTGLYVVVNPDGRRRWTWRFTKPNGRVSEMSLGRYPQVTLADARDRVGELARGLRNGDDPVAAKKAARAKARVDATSFGDVMQLYATAFARRGNAITDMQVLLRGHAAALHPMPIADVTTDIVAKVLAPINAKHPFTARRALVAVSKILKYAKVMKLRTTGDDADWRDVFEHIFAAAKPGPGHRAMPYAQVPRFYARLCERDSATALALRFPDSNRIADK
jgi:hypothetical protein